MARIDQTAALGERMADDMFGIGEVAERYGVTLRTLRFWEAKGLVAPRRVGARRLYDAGQIQQIAVVLKAKRLGFSLMEIRELVDAYRRGGTRAADEYLRRNGAAHRAHLEQTIEDLKRSAEETDAAIETVEGGRTWFGAA